MRQVIFNRSLGGLLDCANGATGLRGDLRGAADGLLAAEFHSAKDAPFESAGSNVVAERARISASNAAGLRKTLSMPFSLGIGTLEGDGFAQLAWKEIVELDEWHPVDLIFELGRIPIKRMYCVFRDLALHYDVAQIDPFMHMRQITLCIELEISICDRRNLWR